MSALQHVRAGSDDELARLLFQAPSVLVDQIATEAGTQLVDVLSEGGIDVELQPITAPFEPGCGEFDIAVFVEDPSALPLAVNELAHLLGVGAEHAVQLLSGQPPIVMGNVSSATVNALTERVSEQPISVVSSRTVKAVYDVYMTPDTGATVRHRVVGRLRGLGLNVDDPAVPTADEGMVVLGLDAEQAREIWNAVGRRTSGVKIVDRAFQRYDILLEALDPSAEAMATLVELTGMPASLAPKVFANLPIVVAQNQTHGEMTSAMQALGAVGAVAVSELTTFRSSKQGSASPKSALANERT
ncbi:hypothetical protein [Granulosicoccus antarcticus]|uniref:hypothetical protein n=1 Tax=Granulosicoccus antarcticus TaxID=437505 RepID=UPI0012FD3675|nr:hypothetical protein [Granulosicoccus antarcticus]